MSTSRGSLLLVQVAAAGLAAASCQDVSCYYRTARPMRLAAGPSQTAQACVAREYSAKLTEDAIEYSASVLETSGSVQSLVALREGRAELAIAPADVLAQAVNGEGAFAGRTVSARTIATLFTSSVHLVVPGSSDVQSFSQLRRHTVATGPPESGMDLTVSRILKTAWLEQGVTVRTLPWPELAAGLRRGDLAGFFWVDGVPSPGVEGAQPRSGAPLRVLSTASVVPLLRRRYGEALYQVSQLPAGAYGAAEPIATVGVATILVARQDLDDAAAFIATRALFRHAAHVVRACPASGALTMASGAQPEPAALHPGAASFYRSAPVPSR